MKSQICFLTSNCAIALLVMSIVCGVTLIGSGDGIEIQKDIVITPSAAAVTLDGKLDDPIWEKAVSLSPFRILGDVMHPSELRNEAFVAVKDGYLYVAYRMQEPNVAGMMLHKPDAELLRLRLAERPPQDITLDPKDMTLGPLSIYADDCAETFLSVDQTSFAHVIVNAAGARYWEKNDANQRNVSWYPAPSVDDFTGDWMAKAVIGKNEWTCELRVKLSDLFGHAVGGKQKIFVDFTRHRTQGKENYLTWAPIIGQFYAVPSEFLPLTLKLPPLVGSSAPEQATIKGVFTKTLSTPDLLIAGQPVKLTLQPGFFRLSSDTKISEHGVTIDQGVKAMLAKALIVTGGEKSEVTLRIADVFDDNSLSAAERKILLSPEAFKLELIPGRVLITGRTHAGVLRGIATLILMANRARFTSQAALPAMALYDAPRLPFRGMMTVTPAMNQRYIDMVFLLRINKIVIALDSFGGERPQFPFDSYPIGQMASRRGVYTKEKLISLFNYAHARGIDVIPYFSSWGRVQYLKNMPGGVDLLVDDEKSLEATYRNLDVANPATHKVMLGLQQEIIDTLHPEGFCIAMDEVHLAHMETSAAARAKGWKSSDWYLEALKVNADFLRRQGLKKMYIWGDMLRPEISPASHPCYQLGMSVPELLKHLPGKGDVLSIFYCSYGNASSDENKDILGIKMLCEAGFSTIGSTWFSPKAIPQTARSIARHGGDGLLMCAWNNAGVDGKHAMPPEQIRACALTAYYSWSPEACDIDKLSFVPDAIMEGASYWTRVNVPGGHARPITVTNGLVSGEKLIKLMGLPAGTDTAFIATPFTNYRGVKPKVFTCGGKPAAVAVEGGRETVIPVNNIARVVTFMHATSCLPLMANDIVKNCKITSKIIPGEYVVRYADGTSVAIPLVYRVNIVAVNDATLGRETDVGLFGTLDGAVFVNMPTFTWANPHSEKTIASIEVRGGDNGKLSLLVFGISLE